MDHDHARLAFELGGARAVRLKPFASDGCSLFPDGDTRSGSSYFPTWYRWGYGWPYGMTGVNAAPDSLRAGEIRKRAAAFDRAAAAREACGEDGSAPKAAKPPK
jgi:hypothetical protein